MDQVTNFAEVEEYLRLDIRAIAAKLSGESLDREAKAGELQLTAAHDLGAPGAGFTPNLVQWFNFNVAPFRARAISRVESDAKAIRLEGGGEGSVEQLALEHAELQRATRIADVSQGFQRENSTLIEEHSRLKEVYTRFRDEEGREAKVAKAWQVFLALAFVLLPESLINFNSFRVAPFIQSDFMAVGITLIVGLAIAVAGHLFGSYVRRINYYRRGDDEGRARSGTPILLFAIFLLAAALAVVAVSRYYYIVPKIAEAVAIGLPPPNLVFSISGLLLGNILCFLLGSIVAFLLHDPNPDYEDTAKNLHRATGKLSTLRRKKIDGKIREINRRLASDKTTATTRAKAIRGRPGYAEIVARFESIKAKDKEVVAAIQEYRDRLVHTISDSGRGTVFRLDDYSGDPMNTRRTIKPHEYANLPISLSVSRG